MRVDWKSLYKQQQLVNKALSEKLYELEHEYENVRAILSPFGKLVKDKLLSFKLKSDYHDKIVEYSISKQDLLALKAYISEHLVFGAYTQRNLWSKGTDLFVNGARVKEL